MLSETRRHVWKLRITLDAKYPGIISRARSSIEAIRGRPAGSTNRIGCIEIHSYWKHWICLFPQHGSGAKHERSIALADWQQVIVEWCPEAFLTGLIHSDGCRFINRVGKYAYARYMFSNRSGEILSLFSMACGLVGADARRAGACNVSVARRASVEILDSFIGPKS